MTETNRFPGRPLTAWLLAILALAATASPAAAQPADGQQPAVHPFYARLLDDGVYALQQGDAEKAATDLRLAAFGMLEAPDRLAHALAYLSLAEAAAGDQEQARDSLGRLISVSDRFGARPEPPLPEDVAERLDELMLAAVPEATLAGSASFRRLADEKFARRLASLPPRERYAALAEKAAAEPDDPRWALALGELDLAAGRTGEAANRAVQVLALTPDEPRAHCLAGLARAGAGACQAALAGLERCPRRQTEGAVAAAWVGCLADLGRWREAQAALTGLPPALRAERPLARLGKRVDREVRRLPVAVEAPATVAAEEGGTAPEEDAGALPAAAQSDLQRARDLLAGARRQSELAEPLRLAGTVADAYPGSTEAQHLAGEIAYRASRWEEAAAYLQRGGEPRRPELRFYLAVSLFESGDREAAAAELERALPGLPRSPFVNSYVDRILGDQP